MENSMDATARAGTELTELLDSLGVRQDPNNPILWNDDLDAEFNAIINGDMLAPQQQYYQQGHAESPQQPANVATVFGNPKILNPGTSGTSDVYQAIPSDGFNLYQSTDSIAHSTTSASSGYYIRQQGHNFDAEMAKLRNRHSLFTNQPTPAINPTPAVDPQPEFRDRNGNLDERAFVNAHPVLATMLSDFVTMTCILMFFNYILQSWPDSSVIDSLALQAIDIILKANTRDTELIAENMAPGLAVLLSKWISIQVRSNLEDILVIARSHAHSFGLSEANNSETNKHNFRAATYLSAYLHKLHFPQSLQDTLRIRYAYVNPALLQVIREAFYTSTTSIVRRTHLIYKKYPSLTWDARLFGFNWRGAFPVNIYVLGAVALRQALKEWETGGYTMLTWGSAARSRFSRMRHALTNKLGNRSYYRKMSQQFGEIWYRDLHLDSVPVTVPQTRPSSDAGSDYDVSH